MNFQKNVKKSLTTLFQKNKNLLGNMVIVECKILTKFSEKPSIRKLNIMNSNKR